MARRKPDFPPPSDIALLIDSDGLLRLRVTPGARIESMTIESGELSVKTRAKPQDGAANAAVMRMLAKALGIAPSRVELLRGETSRTKVLRVSA